MNPALADPVRTCPRCDHPRFPWEFSQDDHCDHCETRRKRAERQDYDRERQRQYYHETRSVQMTRECADCGEEKPITAFGWRKSRGRLYRRRSCKLCYRAKQREWERKSGRDRRPDLPKGRALGPRRILADVRCEAEVEPQPRRLPATRAECRWGPRPCPYVSCRHNLYLDVVPYAGLIKFNFPDVDPCAVAPGVSCALDIADRGGATLERIGDILNLTRERIRQIEVKAVEHFLAGLEAQGVRLEDLAGDGPEAWRTKAKGSR